MTAETLTLTVRPGEWCFVHAYEPHSFAPDQRPFYGVSIKPASLLPEEIAQELYVSRKGYATLKGYFPPVVDHVEGWEKLESELRRMEATNRPRDALFENAVLRLDYSVYVRPAIPGSRFDTPMMLLPISRITILGYDEKGSK